MTAKAVSTKHSATATSKHVAATAEHRIASATGSITGAGEAVATPFSGTAQAARPVVSRASTRGTAKATAKSSSGVATRLPNTKNPTAVFGDGGRTSSLGQGQMIRVPVPYGGHALSWHMSADVACTAEVAVELNGVEMTGPRATLVNADRASGIGWPEDIVPGDILTFRMTSLVGSPKQISISLRVE